MRLIISISGEVDDEVEGQAVLDSVIASLLPFKELGLVISPKVTTTLDFPSLDE